MCTLTPRRVTAPIPATLAFPVFPPPAQQGVPTAPKRRAMATTVPVSGHPAQGTQGQHPGHKMPCSAYNPDSDASALHQAAKVSYPRPPCSKQRAATMQSTLGVRRPCVFVRRNAVSFPACAPRPFLCAGRPHEHRQQDAHRHHLRPYSPGAAGAACVQGKAGKGGSRRTTQSHVTQVASKQSRAVLQQPCAVLSAANQCLCIPLTVQSAILCTTRAPLRTSLRLLSPFSFFSINPTAVSFKRRRCATATSGSTV